MEKSANIDLYIVVIFGNDTKKNPQSDAQIEDLNTLLLDYPFNQAVFNFSFDLSENS